MTDDHDFQKRLAKLQIQASAVVTIGAILIALGFSSLVVMDINPNGTINSSIWRGIIFVVAGIALMFLHLFSIRNKINELR